MRSRSIIGLIVAALAGFALGALVGRYAPASRAKEAPARAAAATRPHAAARAPAKAAPAGRDEWPDSAGRPDLAASGPDTPDPAATNRPRKELSRNEIGDEIRRASRDAQKTRHQTMTEVVASIADRDIAYALQQAGKGIAPPYRSFLVHALLRLWAQSDP